jgi:uncharacterized membrane protein
MPRSPRIASARITSVDALRGLVMIIMALDHTRDFISASAQMFSPEDLTRTTTAIFLTRWITHFCAPTFMFTAGIGAFLSLGPTRTVSDLSRFLWTRGLWLVFLELTVMRFSYGFNFTYQPVLVVVLWALGWSMVALSLLVRIPVRALGALSVAVILGHNLLDGIKPAAFGSWAWVWNVLHQPGFVMMGSAGVVLAYPLVPWIFVMSAGFCFGAVVKDRRTDVMLRSGVGMTVGFIVLRALGIYGEPKPWTGGLLSFLNCTKYPPSLEFLLMTLGPALVVLALFDRIEFKPPNPLIVFGRTPLFFFVLHFYAAHLIALALAWFRYGHAGFLLNPLPAMGGPDVPGCGYGLPVVYAVWAGIVIGFYPLCRWFAGVKTRGKNWWLSYV